MVTFHGQTMAMTWEQAQQFIEALNQQVTSLTAQMAAADARAQNAEEHVRQLVARISAADDAHRRTHDELTEI